MTRNLQKNGESQIIGAFGFYADLRTALYFKQIFDAKLLTLPFRISWTQIRVPHIELCVMVLSTLGERKMSKVKIAKNSNVETKIKTHDESYKYEKR